MKHSQLTLTLQDVTKDINAAIAVNKKEIKKSVKMSTKTRYFKVKANKEGY